MGREKEECDHKFKLVRDICKLSSVACDHKGHGKSFIDWYLVLQVEENACLDLMRKQYRKLVLELHPDKNKHPKAEIAFKLVYEAYACLSNNARRAKFNLERQNNKCEECYVSEHVTKLECSLSTEKMNSEKILQKLGDLRARFSAEAKVMESCFKAISELKRGNSSSRNDYPIFNPSDYLSRGYPHQKTRIYKDSENFRYLWKNSLVNYKQ